MASFAEGLFRALLTLWGVASLVFVLLNVVPADPARLTLGQNTDAASLAASRAALGLDKPLAVRYLDFLHNLSPIAVVEPSSPTLEDRTHLKIWKGAKQTLILQAPYLQRSFQTKGLVGDALLPAFANTAVLALAAMLFATLFGILIGVAAALKPKSWLSKVMMVGVSLGISVPSYLAAVLIAYFFGYVLHEYTGLPITGNLYDYEPDGPELALLNLILPALTLGIRPLSLIAQLTQSSVTQALSHPSTKTAFAKGLSRNRVVYRHALPNALNPVLTAASGWLASLLAGAVFVEYIFGWNGLGKLTVDALLSFDTPLVVGAILLIATIFVTTNLMVDNLYKVLDPRVRV